MKIRNLVKSKKRMSQMLYRSLRSARGLRLSKTVVHVHSQTQMLGRRLRPWQYEAACLVFDLSA